MECYSILKVREYFRREEVGVQNGEDPPVPIPNTVVKLIRAENTWLEAARENRSMPTHKALYSLYRAFSFSILII